MERIYLSSAATAVAPNAVQLSVPGWTIFALFWMAQILALNLMAERTSGIQARIMASPVSSLGYVTGKTIPYLLLNFLQAVVMFAVGVWALPWLGCPRLAVTGVPALALLTLAVSLVSLAFGLLLATLLRSTLLVAVLSAALLIIMGIAGGIMVPKSLMPPIMQRLSLLVPQGWALEGYLDILVRGTSAGHVLPKVGALLGFAALPLFLVLWRRRARRE
ncbi:MAG: ABC transporter permease [Deltaproteobacteria bacterium]|nr:ABC transporter permease [Deltaproteobacteria bacterium]